MNHNQLSGDSSSHGGLLPANNSSAGITIAPVSTVDTFNKKQTGLATQPASQQQQYYGSYGQLIVMGPSESQLREIGERQSYALTANEPEANGPGHATGHSPFEPTGNNPPPPSEPTGDNQPPRRKRPVYKAKTYRQYPYGIVAAIVITGIVLFTLLVMLMATINRPDPNEPQTALTAHQKFQQELAKMEKDGYEVKEYVRRNKGQFYNKQFFNRTVFCVMSSKTYTVMVPNDTSRPTFVGRKQVLDCGSVKAVYNYTLRSEEDDAEIALLTRTGSRLTNPLVNGFEAIGKVFDALWNFVGAAFLIAFYLIILAVVILEIVLIAKLYLRTR